MSSIAFEKTVEQLGNIKEKSVHKVVFKFKEGVNIRSVTTTCGCSVANIDNKKKEIKVTYTAAQVPIHFLQQGFRELAVAKTIEVKYDWPEVLHGTEDMVILFIKGTIKKDL